jgi:hypothetical protein
MVFVSCLRHLLMQLLFLNKEENIGLCIDYVQEKLFYMLGTLIN